MALKVLSDLLPDLIFKVVFCYFPAPINLSQLPILTRSQNVPPTILHIHIIFPPYFCSYGSLSLECLSHPSMPVKISISWPSLNATFSVKPFQTSSFPLDSQSTLHTTTVSKQGSHFYCFHVTAE